MDVLKVNIRLGNFSLHLDEACLIGGDLSGEALAKPEALEVRRLDAAFTRLRRRQAAALQGALRAHYIADSFPIIKNSGDCT
jgi:hypothetical protein